MFSNDKVKASNCICCDGEELKANKADKSEDWYVLIMPKPEAPKKKPDANKKPDNTNNGGTTKKDDTKAKTDKKDKTNTIDYKLEVCKDKCADYKGKQTKTKSGLSCRMWSDESVNPSDTNNKAKKKFIPANYPTLEANYCRNPDPTNNKTIWCYTTDATKPTEDCEPLKDPNAKKADDSNAGKVANEADNAANAGENKDDKPKK